MLGNSYSLDCVQLHNETPQLSYFILIGLYSRVQDGTGQNCIATLQLTVMLVCPFPFTISKPGRQVYVAEAPSADS